METIIILILALIGLYHITIEGIQWYNSLNTYEKAKIVLNDYLKEFLMPSNAQNKITSKHPAMYPIIPSLPGINGEIIIDKTVLISMLSFLNEYYESFSLQNMKNATQNHIWLLYLKVSYPKDKYKEAPEALRQIIRSRLTQVYSQLPEMYGNPLDNLVYVCKFPDKCEEYYIVIGISYSKKGDDFIASYKAKEESMRQESKKKHKDLVKGEDDEDRV